MSGWMLDGATGCQIEDKIKTDNDDNDDDDDDNDAYFKR